MMIEITRTALAALFAAIAEVESNNGATSRNIYQITPTYIQDVNWIMIYGDTKLPYRLFSIEDAKDKDASEQMMIAYWRHWTRHIPDVTLEVLARIHNGGPRGWKKDATLPYWRKVEAAMERAKALANPAEGSAASAPADAQTKGPTP